MDNTPDAATESALQRTASDYDQTPYRSFPYPLTRPAHVAAISHIFGLATPDVATARVLEIGCGGGGNLIPAAAAFPQARFVGLDLSPLQIAEARERAGAAGLANIEFQEGSVTDVDASWGHFDYIVCHGVYSWVPDKVRRAILRVTAERLAESGAGVISYNVLPGWHLRRVARDVMLAHAAHFDAPAEKLGQARAFLDFLAKHAPESTPYGQVLRREAAILAEQSDDYVLHEFLEADNTPCTVTEFVAAAEAAGLGYLGDSEIHTMRPEGYRAEMADQMREIAADPVQLEQYVDLVVGRTFRQSIVVKPAALASVRRAPEASCMAGLHVAITFIDAPQTSGPGPFSFKVRSRRSAETFRTLTTNNPTIARALTALGNRWPSTATAAELAAVAVSGETPGEADTAAVLDMLLHLMMAGMLVVSTAPISVGRADAIHPVVWPLSRADAARGAAETASPHHKVVPLDGPRRALLPLLDGTRDRPALVAALLELLDQGTLELQHDGVPVRNSDVRVTAVTELVDSTLRALASAALLSP
jgi:SAM-dependent methyltransferase